MLAVKSKAKLSTGVLFAAPLPLFSKRVRLISSKRSEAKHKTPYSFISEVTFIYFKVKLLGGLEISPLNLLIFNFATLVTFQDLALFRHQNSDIFSYFVDCFF